MISPLTKLAVIILLPTLSCSAYYLMTDLPPEQQHLIIPVLLCYPLLLFALIGLIHTLDQKNVKRQLVIIYSMVAVICVTAIVLVS